MKFKKPKEIVENFITRKHDEQVDKWNAGLSNNLQEWDDFCDYWDLIESVETLRKDNAELRMYNNKLLNEIKELKRRLSNETK